MKKMLLFIGTLCMIIAQSCTDSTTQQNIDDILADDTVQVKENEDDAKIIFRNVPSPVEMASLLKRAGAKYDESILNPVENKNNYSSNISMALNLGVYSADLSFASMFNQSQASINYLATCKKLAEDLGIMDAISSGTMNRMEDNIQNKDSLMNIISETLMNSDSFLKENERASTAAIVLVGGWLEGLYLATEISKTTEENKELIDRITDQRLSLETLLALLGDHKDDPDVQTINAELITIADIFKTVSVTTSKVEAVTDTVKNTTVLKSNTQVNMSPETYNELCAKVAVFRGKIVHGEII
ncbi:MAG: hypothetical protein KJ607_03610 [Bacteroidetes bacterium]|nr:hypothetical protein [Bacteroidota bacterium]